MSDRSSAFLSYGTSKILESDYYTYKDHDYIVLDIGKMKCLVNKTWNVCVFYQRAMVDGENKELKLGLDSPTYCREIGDFMGKFKDISKWERSSNGMK